MIRGEYTTTRSVRDRLAPEVRDLAGQGLYLALIARQLGSAPGRIRRVAAENNIALPPAPRNRLGSE